MIAVAVSLPFLFSNKLWAILVGLAIPLTLFLYQSRTLDEDPGKLTSN
jgi:hypothetical protein